MGKIDINKHKKRISILNAAYELFSLQGFLSTSISDIAQKAGIAKGTFYLYFKDKMDIRNNLVAYKTNSLFFAANQELVKHRSSNPDFEITFENQLIFVVNYIIDSLTQDTKLMNFIHKNLSDALFHSSFSKETSELLEVRQIFFSMLEISNTKLDNPDIVLFLISELVGSTCYGPILLKEPVDIATFKPNLFQSITAILRLHIIAN